MVGALSRAGIDRAHEVAIVGGGATASSALVAAAQLGAERVTVLVRDVERAQRLVQVGEAAGIAVRIHDVQNPESLAPVDLVISTLPGGAELSLATLPRVSSAILLDVAYSPWPSLRGAEWSSTTPGTPIVVSGLSMLADQALVQVRLFHSGDALVSLPDEEAVRHAMYAAVNLI
jgi:shikimate dehydrogenase